MPSDPPSNMTPELAQQIGDLLVGTQIDPSVWVEEQLMDHNGPECCASCCTWVPHDEVNVDDFFGTLCDQCLED